MKLLLANNKYAFADNLQYGEKFTSSVPFNLRHRIYTYDLDVEFSEIVNSISSQVKSYLIDDTDKQLINKLIESYENLSFDLIERIYVIQNLINKVFDSAGSGSIQKSFLLQNKDANLSQILNANMGMCNEFSVLGHFLLSEFNFDSSVFSSVATKEVINLIKGNTFIDFSERHSMVFLNEYNIVWDVLNPSKFHSKKIPSIYVNKASHVDFIDTLYSHTGGTLDLVAYPKRTDFNFKMTINTK